MMIFEWFTKTFFNKKRDDYIEKQLKELKVRAAELAVFKKTEALRLKAKLTKT